MGSFVRLNYVCCFSCVVTLGLPKRPLAANVVVLPLFKINSIVTNFLSDYSSVATKIKCPRGQLR